MKDVIRLIGIGYIYDPSDGDEVIDFEDFKFARTPKTVEFEKSDSMDSETIEVGASHKASFAIKGYTADWIEKLMGGTKTTGNAYIAYTETNVVPATPYAVTLDHTPLHTTGNYSLRIYEKDSTGKRTYYTLVSSNPATTQYTLSTATVTHAAADEAKTLYYEYLYEGSSDADILTYAPTDNPPARFPITAVLVGLTRGGVKKYITVKMANCRSIGTTEIGGAVQSLAKIPVEVDVALENSGDIEIRFQNP